MIDDDTYINPNMPSSIWNKNIERLKVREILVIGRVNELKALVKEYMLQEGVPLYVLPPTCGIIHIQFML